MELFLPQQIAIYMSNWMNDAVYYIIPVIDLD